MSRGGRSRGGGSFGGRGKKVGPETTWDVEPTTSSSTTRPAPLFPEIPLSVPRALSRQDINQVNHYKNIRSLIRDGPLYAVLDPSQLTDDHGKVNKRAGFDPFEGMPSYSKRYQKSRRVLPDLTTQSFAIEFFPKELWPTIDPEKRNPAWETLGPKLPDPPGMGMASRSKRKVDPVTSRPRPTKRVRRPTPSDGEDVDSDDDGDDAIAPGRREKPRTRRAKSPAERGQRKGLEAEDDYGPDPEPGEDDDPEGEDVLEDSVFEESDDGAGDDYNAENYFDGGDDDGVEDRGGGDDEGGFY